ncbi:MAG: PaaI family thioesterase [Hyphomonas sp.]
MTKTIEKSGEFSGWLTWTDDPFEHETAGPFYFKVDENGPVAAFRVKRKHMNANGVVHGGCLMSFADFALFAIGHGTTDGFTGVTVAFTSEFIDAVLENERLEARGDVLRDGGSLSFIRGIITGEDGRPVLNFSGTIKKRRERKPL